MRKQEPKEQDNWLYRDLTESERVFTKVVYLGINDTEWAECTDAEKAQWESEHPQEQEQDVNDEQSRGIQEE